jgi:HK97 family phage prohead protease
MSENLTAAKFAECEYKSFPLTDIELTKAIGDIPDGTFRGFMATEHPDRGNDIIAPDAFDKSLARYKKQKRPVKLFYQHNTLNPPIGIIPIKSVEKEGKNWKVEGELNLDTQLGHDVYALMKQGALSDLSIGFSIIDQEFKGHTRIITELELWEVSVVSEPMNPKAVINEVKAATSFQDLPLGDRNAEWDSNKAIQRLRKFTNSEDGASATYRKGFLWFDSKDAANLTAYKLPFADVVDGKLVAMPRGIFAAAAALRGARGGVELPEGDRNKVITHVNKYYDKMGLESPLSAKNIDREYVFTKKLEIDEVETIASREEFNELLRKSGVFSKSACEFLASCFVSKQSKSVMSTQEAVRLLQELKNLTTQI